MRRSARIRMVVILALAAALGLFVVPVVTPAAIAASAEPAVTATESVSVTDLPTAGHGIREPSDAGTLALRHTLLTVLVLLVAAGMALGGLGLFWRYERR